MVTCKVDAQQAVAITKMNSVRTRKPSSSNSSGFRLLDGDQLESSSSVSRNSVYKLKIDLMFDDTRSIRSNQLDDVRGSQRTRSIIMYGRSELASTAASAGGGGVSSTAKSLTNLLQETASVSAGGGGGGGGGGGIGGTQTGGTARHLLSDATKHDVQRISNTVQAQIEQLFTDVAKDATSSFAVTCLGSLPLKDKVTSLQGLQEPLRELYLKEIRNEKPNSGFLDICATGLRVKQHSDASIGSAESIEGNITPFHHIAVWSAVKFVVSAEDGGAAFLPLITDPDNIDKASLFQPLSPLEQRYLNNSTHAPIFAVVMRSANLPKVLECHGFVCKSTEDAIVIAATLYQSLMAHVSNNSHRSTKRRTPRNQNGVSCVSIASSSAQTGSNYLSRSQLISSSGGRKSSFRSSNGSVVGTPTASSSMRSARKKRLGGSSLSTSANVIDEMAETTTEERKRKSHKTKRAPPIPTPHAGTAVAYGGTPSYKGLPLDALACGHAQRSSAIYSSKRSQRSHRHHAAASRSSDSIYRAAELVSTVGAGAGAGAGGGGVGASSGGGGALRAESTGDILTRVAIPRSGSFLNTGGLTRYKSRATRRNSGKLSGSGGCGGGGGGGSPLGFSELFNEFRLHENLHSLDDILYAIIDADGMSFNDLKPIYKEFLLKLAVTLTKDELFQRSKNIMRRQKKKKKLKRKGNSSSSSQKKPKGLMFGTKNLKRVFQLGQFRSCRGKPPSKPMRKDPDIVKPRKSMPLSIGPPLGGGGGGGGGMGMGGGTTALSHGHHQGHRNRVATSGSDVSVVRQEHAFHGLNRNSSSGYVSCSECSYDSESCTCASADRCYCSLRTEHTNNTHRKTQQHGNSSSKLLRKNEHNTALAKQHSKSSSRKHDIVYTPALSAGGGSSSGGGGGNRISLPSCKSDDKCYCSMAEAEPASGDRRRRHAHEDDAQNTLSDTTWCDTDSCISASKCYCKRTERRSHGSHVGSEGSEYSQRRRSRPSARKPSAGDKLAFDYELFTIDGNSKSVQPHEALSVKKSVEAAAIFADMKLSQTTDIKSLCGGSTTTSATAAAAAAAAASMAATKSSAGSVRTKTHTTRSSGSMRSQSSSTRRRHVEASYNNRRRDSFSIDRKNERALVTLSSGASQKSCSADDLLSKLSAIEQSIGGHVASSVKSGASQRSRAALGQHHHQPHQQAHAKDTLKSSYQSMRAVSASLEDTLGYLP